MLSEIAVLLTTDGTWRPELVVDVVDVPLQVGLKVAAVAALRALEVLHLNDNQRDRDSEDLVDVLLGSDLHVLLVDVMPQVCELSVAMRTGLGLAGGLLLYLVSGHHGVVIHVVVVVVVIIVIEETCSEMC